MMFCTKLVVPSDGVAVAELQTLGKGWEFEIINSDVEPTATRAPT